MFLIFKIFIFFIELYSSVVHYPPYVLAEDQVDGVEVRPQLEFCRIHNCSLKIRTSKYLWGDIWANGSGNGKQQQDCSNQYQIS